MSCCQVYCHVSLSILTVITALLVNNEKEIILTTHLILAQVSRCSTVICAFLSVMHKFVAQCSHLDVG